MIPTIGIMVGAYIFVRMLSLATRRGERRESILVIVFSILVMILTLFCMASLLLSGAGRLLDSIVASRSASPPHNEREAAVPHSRETSDIGSPDDRETYVKMRAEVARSLGLSLRADGFILQLTANHPIPAAQMRDEAAKFAKDAGAVVAGFRSVRITDSIGNSWTERATGPTGVDDVAPFPTAAPRG